MHKTLAPMSALNQDQMLAAALLELDLEAAQRQRRRVGPMTRITTHREEHTATKRANRSTLNEIAASLGVSRSTVNRILDEPSLRAGDRHVEPTETGWDGKRHDHGVGRRRHAGAGRRRPAGAGIAR